MTWLKMMPVSTVGAERCCVSPCRRNTAFFKKADRHVMAQNHTCFIRNEDPSSTQFSQPERMPGQRSEVTGRGQQRLYQKDQGVTSRPPLEVWSVTSGTG